MSFVFFLALFVAVLHGLRLLLAPIHAVVPCRYSATSISQVCLVSAVQQERTVHTSLDLHRLVCIVVTVTALFDAVSEEIPSWARASDQSWKGQTLDRFKFQQLALMEEFIPDTHSHRRCESEAYTISLWLKYWR